MKNLQSFHVVRISTMCEAGGDFGGGSLLHRDLFFFAMGISYLFNMLDIRDVSGKSHRQRDPREAPHPQKDGTFLYMKFY